MEAEKTVLILGAIKILLGFLYLVCTIVYNVEIGSPNVITFVGCIPVSDFRTIQILQTFFFMCLLMSMSILQYVSFSIPHVFFVTYSTYVSYAACVVFLQTWYKKVTITAKNCKM